MAVDIQTLVETIIKPALIVDTSLSTDLPVLIEAQVALEGKPVGELTDGEKVYLAALTLESLVPRLMLTYTDEVQEHTAGPETVKLPSRADLMKAIQAAIAAFKKTATAKQAGGTEDKAEKPQAWPSVGIRGIT